MNLTTNPTCLSLRNNAACCIRLRHLRENIHARVLNLYTQKKPQYLPQISQIYADEPQNEYRKTKLNPKSFCLTSGVQFKFILSYFILNLFED